MCVCNLRVFDTQYPQSQSHASWSLINQSTLLKLLGVRRVKVSESVSLPSEPPNWLSWSDVASHDEEASTEETICSPSKDSSSCSVAVSLYSTEILSTSSEAIEQNLGDKFQVPNLLTPFSPPEVATTPTSLLMHNENSLVDIYVWDLYAYGWYLYGCDFHVYGWYLCVWVRHEWRWDLCVWIRVLNGWDFCVWLLCMIVYMYNYVYMCNFFSLKLV
jgi:hypothetical protein